MSLPNYKTNHHKVDAISLNSFVFTEEEEKKELPIFEIQKHSMHHMNMHVLRGNINYLLLPILQLYYGIQCGNINWNTGIGICWSVKI